MKKAALIFLGAAIVQTLLVPSVLAQYRGARSYTQRIAPLLPPPQQPARPPQQAPAVVPGAPAVVQRPVDPVKAKAAKEEAERKTVEFQKKRATAGSATAQYDLGVRYMTGAGVSRDFKEARKWLELAAKNGNSQAPKKLEELAKLEKGSLAALPVRPGPSGESLKAAAKTGK